jgi:hypothetical protein
MVQHIITLTETEDAALSYAAFSQQDWVQNAAKARASAAIDEIVQLTVQKCLEENIQIPGSKEAIVALAFEQEWVKTAAERHAESGILQSQ